MGSALLSRDGDASNTFEALEARQLLSAQLPEGAEWVAWGDSQVAALSGSYVLSFNQQLGKEGAEMLAREFATRLGVSPTKVQSIARGYNALIEFAEQLDKAAFELAARHFSQISSFQPNQVFQSARVPNDPQFIQQYSLNNTGQFVENVQGVAGADIDVQSVWDTTIGSRNIVIGVIDTGVDIEHPDLIPNLWTNPGEVAGNGVDDDGNGYVDDIHGYDFGQSDGNPDDDPIYGGHGTAVAGVIGAAGNNGLGVSGVNWNVSLMGLKIADAFGRLSSAAIIGAHDYATLMIGRGINIVATNNSYGAFAPAFYEDQDEGFVAERQAIERFVATGATFVAAAGNNGADNDGTFTAFPASYNIPGVISVSASDNQDQMANFSNYGARTVDIAAPGVNVLTTDAGGGYTYISGTSFAAPTIAGIVGLIKSVKPNASAVEIREALINSADQLPAFQGRNRAGGRVNAARAIQIIQTAGPTVRSVDPGSITGQTIPGTSTPINTIAINFSKDIDPNSLTTSGITLINAGTNGTFGNGDDVTIPVAAVARSTTDPRLVTITLNLTGFSGQRLPVGSYRLTLASTAFKDLEGNRLNGNTTTGTNEVYNFSVVPFAGENESNDTLSAATRVSFGATGDAFYTGVTLGNGIFNALDVDLYRLDLSRGGLISAQITAARLPAPSTLDSYLRLFDANGVELTNNDQAFGNDSALEFFVTTGGIYYVGVSGYGNFAYNVNTGGSGNTQSTGVYNLKLSTRLAQDDVVGVPYYSRTGLTAGTDPFLNSSVITRLNDDTYDPFASDAQRNLFRVQSNIPPNQPTQTLGITTSFLDITDTREILDVNLKLRLNHTFTGELIISLIAPDNTEVILSNRRGASGDNFTNTIFDDEASIAVSAAAAPFGGPLRPDQFLGLMDGKAAAGRWTLKINDTTALNVGQIDNWALEFTFQNNIFGPFESNDTLVTANDLAEIAGSGTAQRAAFLGDGGFGSFDRDLFRFVADAGTTLTAVVAPQGTFNSVIRLFDANGTQILIANPTDRTDSRLDGYVIANSGTYYLGVSEANNTGYIPTLVGDASSRPALTTGNYTLSVTLSVGVSDQSTTYLGNQVAFGMNTGGTLQAPQSSGNPLGLVYQGIDFLPFTGPAQMTFGAAATGLGFSNAGPARSNDVAFSLTDASDPFNFRVSAKAQYKGLKIERSFTLGENDSFLVVDVYLTNTTTGLLSNVAWMEAFNPNPGLSLGENNRSTINDVRTGAPLATSRYVNNQFGQGLTIGLGAASSDTRARATFVSPGVNFRDAAQLLALPANDPNGIGGDAQMGLVYDLGTLAAGGSTQMRYFIFFGTDPTSVDATYDTMNSGTGTGHLTANAAAPANGTLSDGSLAPELPYRVYYPEGFYGNNIFTFVPVANPNDQPARVFAVARYEVGERDSVIGEITVSPNARSGFTIIDPGTFAGGTSLIRPGSGYAIELRSDRPIAATFSHYDLNLLEGFKAAVGESFTSNVDNNWAFGQINRGGGNLDFLVFYNTSSAFGKVTATFFPQSGGTSFVTARNTEGFRRGGWAVNDITLDEASRLTQNLVLTENYTLNVAATGPQGQTIPAGTFFAAGSSILAGTTLRTGTNLPPGSYGVTLTSTVPIVASVSHYNATARNAEGMVGSSGTLTTTGFVAEGQFGLNATKETIGVFNPGNTAATVVLSFLQDNGSAYRTSITVPASTNRTLEVASLPNFPTGRPYGVYFESNTPVIVNAQSDAFGQQLATASAANAYTYWGFGEGFRPGDQNTGHPGVEEYLRLYNPTTSDVVVEISIGYDGAPGTETFRRVLPARRVAEFDIDQFITGSRRLTDQFFSTTVKSATPIVAYMAHFDRAFPGAFGTLGTPLGRLNGIT